MGGKIGGNMETPQQWQEAGYLDDPVDVSEPIPEPVRKKEFRSVKGFFLFYWFLITHLPEIIKALASWVGSLLRRNKKMKDENKLEIEEPQQKTSFWKKNSKPQEEQVTTVDEALEEDMELREIATKPRMGRAIFQEMRALRDEVRFIKKQLAHDRFPSTSDPAVIEFLKKVAAYRLEMGDLNTSEDLLEHISTSTNKEKE